MRVEMRLVVLDPRNDEVRTAERDQRLGRHRPVVREPAAELRPRVLERIERLVDSRHHDFLSGELY